MIISHLHKFKQKLSRFVMHLKSSFYQFIYKLVSTKHIHFQGKDHDKKKIKMPPPAVCVREREKFLLTQKKNLHKLAF